MLHSNHFDKFVLISDGCITFSFASSQLPVLEAGLTKTYQIPGLPGRLVICDAGKNIYGSPYHIREPLCSELNISVMDFLQCSRTWKSKLLALTVSTIPWTISTLKVARCENLSDSNTLLSISAVYLPAGWESGPKISHWDPGSSSCTASKSHPMGIS